MYIIIVCTYIHVCYICTYVDPKKKKQEKRKEKHKASDRSKSDSQMQPPPPYVAEDAELMALQGEGWIMPQKEFTFETYCKIGNSMQKQEKVKVQNQMMGGLNLHQQQYLLQQHWKDKEVMENQQKKILEQKQIISEQQRQIMQQNETHLFFQEQINSLQQQVNSLTNQNQRLSADFSAKSPSNILVRSPMAASSPQSSSSSSSYDIAYSHSPTSMTSNRGFPLEYARGAPPPYSACPPPYHNTSRPVMTENQSQLVTRNAGMMDGKMLTVPNPQLMTSSADRKMMSQQNLLLSAANSIQQPISVSVASSSSASHHFPLTGPPPTTTIKVTSPTHSLSINTSHNKNFSSTKMAPAASSIHLHLPPGTSTYSTTTGRIPMEKSEIPTEFDSLEFQKFADSEVNRLSEAFDSGTAAAATGSSDNEIWQLSLSNLDVATGYGVSMNTDEGKGLDILNTNVKSRRCVGSVSVCSVCV